MSGGFGQQNGFGSATAFGSKPLLGPGSAPNLLKATSVFGPPQMQTQGGQGSLFGQGLNQGGIMGSPKLKPPTALFGA